MTDHQIVSHEQWVEARKQLLAREKELTRLRDQLSRRAASCPGSASTRTTRSTGRTAGETLADLFDGRSQLVVYHFMFGPDWEAGCKSCSFWADNFERNVVHLAARDVTLVAVSRAPLAKLDAFSSGMGWTFKWVSSAGSDFNFDFGVSFTPEEQRGRQDLLQFRLRIRRASEAPGISVFHQATRRRHLPHLLRYARGLDMMNAAYNYLDLVPKGRDEAEQRPHPMAWVRLRDSYGA